MNYQALSKGGTKLKKLISFLLIFTLVLTLVQIPDIEIAEAAEQDNTPANLFIYTPTPISSRIAATTTYNSINPTASGAARASYSETTPNFVSSPLISQVGAYDIPMNLGVPYIDSVTVTGTSNGGNASTYYDPGDHRSLIHSDRSFQNGTTNVGEIMSDSYPSALGIMFHPTGFSNEHPKDYQRRYSWTSAYNYNLSVSVTYRQIRNNDTKVRSYIGEDGCTYVQVYDTLIFDKNNYWSPLVLRSNSGSNKVLSLEAKVKQNGRVGYYLFKDDTPLLGTTNSYQIHYTTSAQAGGVTNMHPNKTAINHSMLVPLDLQTAIKLDELKSQMNTINTQVGTNTTAVNSLQTTVNSMSTNLNSVTTKVNTLDTRTVAMQTAISSLQTQANTTNTKIDNINTKLDNLSNDIDNRVTNILNSTNSLMGVLPTNKFTAESDGVIKLVLDISDNVKSARPRMTYDDGATANGTTVTFTDYDSPILTISVSKVDGKYKVPSIIVVQAFDEDGEILGTRRIVRKDFWFEMTTLD